MKEMNEIVCRCEEVTKEEIIEAIKAGDTTLDAIKKRTRAGMGFCQGRTCRRLISQLICAYSEINVSPADAIDSSIRMPIGPLSIGLIADTVDGVEE